MEMSDQLHDPPRLYHTERSI